MSVERHPVDFDALCKGQLIADDEVARLMCVKRDDGDDFRLAKLRLAGMIQMQRRDLVARAVADGIRILTDPESAPYLARKQKRRVRGMRRDHRQLVTVDRARLSSEQREEHDRNIVVSSRRVQALADVRERLVVGAHRRSTPGLPPRPADSPAKTTDSTD